MGKIIRRHPNPKERKKYPYDPDVLRYQLDQNLSDEFDEYCRDKRVKRYDLVEVILRDYMNRYGINPD